MYPKFLFLYIFVQTAVAANNEENNFKNSIVSENLLLRIENEKWSDDEACFEDMRRWLRGVQEKKLWANWYMDSNQLPVASLYGSRYHLGSFDQCLHPPWEGTPDLEMQYCLVDITSEEGRRSIDEQVDPYSNVEEFVRTKTKCGRRFYMNSVGICLPSSCKPQLIVRITQHMVEISHLPTSNVSLEADNCQRVGSHTEEYSTGFYLFWFIIIITTSLAITAHLFEDTTNLFVSKLLHPFNPTKNYEALHKVDKDEILSLNGIRAISSGFIIVLHYLTGVNSLPVINHVSIDKAFATVTARSLLHLDLVIDTFLILSGILNMKRLLTTKSSGLSIIVKRYLRLFSPYAIILLYATSVSQHVGSGPFWPKFLRESHKDCLDNWWIGLLMVGNVFRTDHMCYIVSWYISCDFQLTIFGILFMYIWKKYPNHRQILSVTTFAMSIIIPANIIYWNNLPPLLQYDNDLSLDLKANVYLKKVYLNSYCRVSSYLVGLAFGYILTVYKPQQYRDSLSKKLSILLFIGGSSMMVLAMFVVGSLCYDKYDVMKTTVYGAIDKPLWAIGVCCIIAGCEYGSLPLINFILSNKLFIFLGKLSYGSYMYHLAILYKTLYSIRSPITYEPIGLIINGLGYISIAKFLSFLLWFTIEAPVNNIVNYKRKSSPLKDQINGINGHTNDLTHNTHIIRKNI